VFFVNSHEESVFMSSIDSMKKEALELAEASDADALCTGHRWLCG
jgi:hypothetical protein